MMDTNKMETHIDILGWLVILGSLAGVIMHGIGRLFMRAGNREEE